MKKLSRFDLGMIIAFVVVALLGGAAWYFLSGQLQTVQGEVTAAAANFDKYTKGQVYLPTATNKKTLTNNIAVMTSQLDPIVKSELQAPGNKLATAVRIDTVTWKQNLDDEVRRLNTAATLHGIVVPKNFYYGFSRYLNTNPPEEATPVLTRQQLGIEEIADTLINAPVRGIRSVRRTYEEDAPASAAGGGSTNSSRQDTDALAGSSLEATGGVYTAYPFEIEFDTNTEGFRKVVDGLMKSPYVFVIRSITVQNSKIESPKIRDIEKMSGVSADPNAGLMSLVHSSPGEVGAKRPASPTGPQFLFGDETLHVRARIDLIDWHGASEKNPVHHQDR